MKAIIRNKVLVAIASLCIGLIITFLVVLFAKAGFSVENPDALVSDRASNSCFTGPDEVEPNNDGSQANGPLCSNMDYFGLPNDPNDYFYIVLSTPGQITIDVTDHPLASVQGAQLQLFYQGTNPENRVAFDLNNDLDNVYHIDYSATDIGTYFILVFTDLQKCGNCSLSYTLRATFPSATLAYTMTLSNLWEKTGRLSSVYVITNTGTTDASTIHEFFDDNDAFLGTFFDVIPPSPIILGNFESGVGDWSLINNGLPAGLITSTSTGDLDIPIGKFSVLLGKTDYPCQSDGTPIGYAEAKKTFMVPNMSGSGPTGLSFRYVVYTLDTMVGNNGIIFDRFEVYINGESSPKFVDGNTINANLSCSNWRRVPGPENPRNGKSTGWVDGYIDLNNYRGQTITVSFRNYNRQDGWYNTYTYLDDVQVVFSGGNGSNNTYLLDNIPFLPDPYSGYVIVGSDQPVTATVTYNFDPLYSAQWGLHQVNALQAWLVTQGLSNTTIAVIDTGVEYTHEDLSGVKTNTDDDWDYVNHDPDALDDNGHGTHVAGIAAANSFNGVGISGVCPQCRILTMKTLNASGVHEGLLFNDVSSAIISATNLGAQVINLSLGDPACTIELANAVNYAYDQGVTLVAGTAGNYRCPVNVALETFDIWYPAKFERVISVGATNHGNSRASFSNFGAELDISAPGVDILSTYLGGSYAYLDGTSMATPFVAGTAGLLLSLDPGLTNAEVQDILQRSATDIGSPGWDPETGWGLLDAGAAVTTPAGPTTPAPPAVCSASGSPEMEGNLADVVGIYTRLRDEVLVESLLGQEYVRLFYRYGPQLANILLIDSALRARTAQFLQNASDEFGSLLPGSIQDLTLSQALYNEADALVTDLANAGNLEFQSEMMRVWGEMELDKQIGNDTKEIWEEMNREYVYLPVVIR